MMIVCPRCGKSFEPDRATLELRDKAKRDPCCPPCGLRNLIDWMQSGEEDIEEEEEATN